jgi:hypothetical protein
MPNGDPGPYGGGTYTGTPTDPTIRDYENIFGPSARDIKDDLQKYKRHGRWHLPDILKGPNPWLTDRVDGLITDATNSPFTSIILPYRYHTNVDGKLKWNVWSFDEGMASRVPYEAAARTLTQSKSSFASYMVRHGLAINLEHNFMMTQKGRENFQNQLRQLVGSIQYSNDLDVHMALILAPSYEKQMTEKYFNGGKTGSQICMDFVNLFGFLQKNPNGLDILIEEAKYRLKSWGGPMPDFMLANIKLGFQLTMTPEKTNYLTQGPDGVKRLKAGPEISSYRGLKIINTRSFSMETGQAPRDILRRRVRVAEYHRIYPHINNVDSEFELYDESKDNWFSLTWTDLVNMSQINPPQPCYRWLGNFSAVNTVLNDPRLLAEYVRQYDYIRKNVEIIRQVAGLPGNADFVALQAEMNFVTVNDLVPTALRTGGAIPACPAVGGPIHWFDAVVYPGGGGGGHIADWWVRAWDVVVERFTNFVDGHPKLTSLVNEIVIIRPNIEHYMLGVIMGLAGDSLGNTLWGQTELSVYDDSMHGVWGMSYKYHERAIVFNEKNLIRLWDVAYDGYNGGKDNTYVKWTDPMDVVKFKEATLDMTKNYDGQSMMVMKFKHSLASHVERNWPSPILFDDNLRASEHRHEMVMELKQGYDNSHVVDVRPFRVFNSCNYDRQYMNYHENFPSFVELHNTRKSAGLAAQEGETVSDSLAFQGTMRIKRPTGSNVEVLGSGHHGPDYVGASSVRSGKGVKIAPQEVRFNRLI